MSEQRQRSYGGLLLPIVLIALGVAFLLGNLGYLPPISARALFSLWPLVLVLIGIDIIFARRQPYLALGLQLAAIAVGVAIVAAQPAGLFAPVGATTTDQTIEREGATSISLRVAGGAGDYTVTGGASGLADVHSDGGAVRVRTTRSDGRADVRVDPVGDPFPFSGLPRNVTVRVANDVAASIRLEGGAGEFTLDMRDLTVTDARIGAGASNVTVVLPTKPQGDVAVRVEAGAASITIDVPDEVEARVTTHGGAISLNSTDARLAPVSGAAQTARYANATARVTVTIEAGATSVTIR